MSSNTSLYFAIQSIDLFTSEPSRSPYCQLQVRGDSTGKFIARTDFDRGNDAVVFYWKNGGGAIDRLRTLHALAIQTLLPRVRKRPCS
jgi:hypothetical protein